LTLRSTGAYRFTNLETSVEKTQRTYIYLLVGGFVGLLLLIFGIWAGHGAYVRWQERRLIQRGVAAMAQHNLRDASLAARTVLELKPNSVPGSRLMADVAERVGDRAAMDWRAKVVALLPQSNEDKIAWARCALQFDEPATAERELGEVNDAGKQAASYHAAAAVLAQVRHETDKAESEWAEAVRLADNDKSYQLQLGIARSKSPDPAHQREGETILQGLRNDADQRGPATRALITIGVSHHVSARQLVAWARELQEYPEATFSDHLLYLDLLHQTHDAQFGPFLGDIEKSALSHPGDLAALLSWMSQNNLNLVALDYARSFPQEVAQKWPVVAALAEVYTRVSEWRKLETALGSASWGEFDFLRHAYLALAAEKQDKPAAREREWAAAIKGAAARSEATMMLFRTISPWHWDNETVALLWTLTSYPDKKHEAFATLYQYYSGKNDTQGLYKLLVHLHEADPNDLNIANNLAQVSLLLNADVTAARKLAADVYAKAPSNPVYATTYGYALLNKGDARAAAKVIGSLPPDQLRNPAVSAYYGFCLAALKDPRAREFLDIGRTAPLLPEEKALLEKAEASLASAPTTAN
jgi:hypothetical protein